jgi:hypothetical protein
MKKFIWISIMVLTGIQTFSQDKMNKVSINPIYLFLQNITNMEYERGFSDGKLGISAYIGWTGYATRELFVYESWTNEQNISLKFYPNSISSRSFWYGGQLSVVTSNVYKVDNYDERATGIGTLGLFAKFGYQFIFKSFYLDLTGSLG